VWTFFPAFIAGVERVLSDRSQALVLQVVPNQQAEENSYRRMAADGRVDGVFLLDLRLTDPRITLLHELGLPAVTIGRPDTDSPLLAVLVNDRPAIAAAVAHLVEPGPGASRTSLDPATFCTAPPAASRGRPPSPRPGCRWVRAWYPISLPPARRGRKCAQ
jgi:hypothetical protein